MGRKTMLTAVVALALAVAACGGAGEPDAVLVRQEPGAGDTGTDGQMAPEPPEIESPIEPMGDPSEMGEGATEDADTVMTAAGIDAEAFWATTYPAVYGEPYVPLEGGFWSYASTTPAEDLPPCGVTAYDEIAENAFYCSDSDLIAWDREALIGPIIDEFGAFTAAVVMAHEMGHAIQARTGDFDTLPGVVSELQADCFAGAWVTHVVDGGSETFVADADELDLAVAGLIAIRDAPGSSPDDPAAHGSGFDRVSAFSDGLSESASRCATYGEEPPVITEQTFDGADAATGGDLPTDELLPILTTDLEDFYRVLFEGEGSEWEAVGDVTFFDPAADEVTCGDTTLDDDEEEFAVFWCPDDNQVYVDGTGLLPALEEIGDYALASELARQWAVSAQEQLGRDSEGKVGSLDADCLTGLYSGDVYFELRETSEFRLSAGDLDEAIISFLAFGESGETDETGSPFERSDAFRAGFLGELTDCDALAGG